MRASQHEYGYDEMIHGARTDLPKSGKIFSKFDGYTGKNSRTGRCLTIKSRLDEAARTPPF